MSTSRMKSKEVLNGAHASLNNKKYEWKNYLRQREKISNGLRLLYYFHSVEIR